MIPFIEIEQKASSLQGGMSNILQNLVLPESAEKIQTMPDNRWLSAISKIVFQAGFNWEIVETKWTYFEQTFSNFNVNYCLSLSDEKLESLMMNGKIVKHWRKVKSIQENAFFLKTLVDKHGSIGSYFSKWETESYGENMHFLQSQGSRLGGKTAQIFLRRMGVDTLVFTNDVMKALKRECQINTIPKSKKSWATIQSIINTWQHQSGRTLNEISQILALSIQSSR